MRSKATPKKKSLGDLLKQAKAQAAPSPRRMARTSQPPLTFTTIALTPAAKRSLDSLTTQVTQQTGRKASASAIVRALLHLADQQNLTKPVVTAVETELNTGAVVWGKLRTGR